LGACKAMLKVLADTMKKTGNLATFGMVEMTFLTTRKFQRRLLRSRELNFQRWNL